jgi:hypothetical protein
MACSEAFYQFYKLALGNPYLVGYITRNVEYVNYNGKTYARVRCIASLYESYPQLIHLTSYDIQEIINIADYLLEKISSENRFKEEQWISVIESKQAKLESEREEKEEYARNFDAKIRMLKAKQKKAEEEKLDDDIKKLVHEIEESHAQNRGVPIKSKPTFSESTHCKGCFQEYDESINACGNPDCGLSEYYSLPNTTCESCGGLDNTHVPNCEWC